MHPENRFIDLVNEGIDLAIRTGMMSDSSLIARPLIDSHWLICRADLQFYLFTEATLRSGFLFYVVLILIYTI